MDLQLTYTNNEVSVYVTHDTAKKRIQMLVVESDK